MTRKPQIVAIVLAFLLAGFLFTLTRCDYDVGLLMKKFEAQNLWQTSAHADATAEAFTHWNEDTPPIIPTSCAKCHSIYGFLDYLGADGTPSGQVDYPAPVGSVIYCETCHTDRNTGTLREHTSVVFPSGVEVSGLGPEALCMECHQGRSSTPAVDAVISQLGLPDEDTVSTGLSFQNIHYYAAAPTQFGTLTQGGYEYSGRSYDGRFAHVKGYNACITCHNPHSLKIDLNRCRTCHAGVTDPRNIRYYGSFVDYDGDGNISEGIHYEIEDIQDRLYQAIQAYGLQIGAPIVYDDHAHPYFFNDLNGNGLVDAGEAIYANRYRSFTPRLLRAAYNFQVARKDPGAFAHGGKYIIQLLYDAIEDLNSFLASPISLEKMTRTDEGHFDGSAEAWRHWDGDGEVEEGCARCHSAEGLPYFLENAVNVAQEPSNGLLCTTCHTSPPGLRRVSAVTFPSGVSKDMGDSSNLCLNCHQGRASKLSVDEATSSPGPYSFINIHYYPTAAVLYGSEVHGGYEFDGKVYAGRKLFTNHSGRFDTCVECHMGTNTVRETPSLSDHNVQKPNPEDCVYCHGQDISQPEPGADPSRFEFSGIRPASVPDYDADGNISESLKNEIEGLEAALYARIQFYAATTLLAPIVYDPHVYPYFFNDTNGNGQVDPGENIFPNRYRSFDAALLRATYNYQVSKKEPCGFIHNSRYIAQLLVDSIEHLGGNISPYIWR